MGRAPHFRRSVGVNGRACGRLVKNRREGAGGNAEPDHLVTDAHRARLHAAPVPPGEYAAPLKALPQVLGGKGQS